MKTVDVRVLLPDDVDVERFVERLGNATRHHEVLGATQVELVDPYSDGQLEPTGPIYRRGDGPKWRGEEVYR